MQCTPYPLTATIFSTDLFYQDPKSSKIFNYEPDMINTIMNGSEESNSHSRQTSYDETHNRQGHSTNTETIQQKFLSTAPRHGHVPDETESLLAQYSGLAQMASPG